MRRTVVLTIVFALGGAVDASVATQSGGAQVRVVAAASRAAGSRAPTAKERAGITKVLPSLLIPLTAKGFSAIKAFRIAISTADDSYAAVEVGARYVGVWDLAFVFMHRTEARWRIVAGPGTLFTCSTPLPPAVRADFGGSPWNIQPCPVSVPQLPRILIAKIGTQSPMTLYKPLNFAPSSHYYVKNAHWIEWDTSRAVARAVLQTQFPLEPLRTEMTTITFSAPKHVCGVYTYTVFRAPGADATLEVASLAAGPQGLYCVFIVG